MSNMKILGLIGVFVVSTIALSGCTSGTDSAETLPALEPEKTVDAPTPTEDDTVAFGQSVTLEFDGAVWEVTITAPADAPERIAEDFPLPEEQKYVAVSGTATRVDGGLVSPISELDVKGLSDNVLVSDEYLSDDEFVSLNAAPEVTNGGTIAFTQMFPVTVGSSVDSVIVYLGFGEDPATAIYGAPVDLGSAADAAAVEMMKSIWMISSPEERAQSATNWDLDGGSVSDAGVAELVQESEENGMPLTADEARMFLEWALTQ